MLGAVPLIAGVVLGAVSPIAIACFIAAGLTFLGLIILLLVWLCTKGNYGPNRFGNDPFEREDIAEVFS